jgi:hypothetical protein
MTQMTPATGALTFEAVLRNVGCGCGNFPVRRG